MRNSITGIATVLALGISLSTTLANAQQCAEGRAMSDATAGRCCWPGQSWNDAAARCEGPPACPSGLVAQGDQCVASVARPPAPAEPTFAPQPQYAQPTVQESPHHLRIESEASEPIVGLVGTAGISLAVTYLATIVVATFNLAEECYGNCGWYALNYIPVAGAIAFTAIGGSGGVGYSSSAEAWALAFYFPSAIIQTLTFGLVLAGLAVRRPKRPSHARFDPVPELVGGPGEAGVGLRWSF